MKLPFVTQSQLDALHALILELQDRVDVLEKQPKPEQPKQQRLMTSARVPSLIRKLEARDVAKMSAPGKIVRNVAKGPEPA